MSGPLEWLAVLKPEIEPYCYFTELTVMVSAATEPSTVIVLPSR